MSHNDIHFICHRYCVYNMSYTCHLCYLKQECKLGCAKLLREAKKRNKSSYPQTIQGVIYNLQTLSNSSKASLNSAFSKSSKLEFILKSHSSPSHFSTLTPIIISAPPTPSEINLWQKQINDKTDSSKYLKITSIHYLLLFLSCVWDFEQQCILHTIENTGAIITLHYVQYIVHTGSNNCPNVTGKIHTIQGLLWPVRRCLGKRFCVWGYTHILSVWTSAWNLIWKRLIKATLCQLQVMNRSRMFPRSCWHCRKAQTSLVFTIQWHLVYTVYSVVFQLRFSPRSLFYIYKKVYHLNLSVWSYLTQRASKKHSVVSQTTASSAAKLKNSLGSLL